jgi:hypothetical protein
MMDNGLHDIVSCEWMNAMTLRFRLNNECRTANALWAAYSLWLLRISVFER